MSVPAGVCVRVCAGCVKVVQVWDNTPQAHVSY